MITDLTGCKCLYTATSDLPKTPYVTPTVTPWSVGFYSGYQCASASTVRAPAITSTGWTTMPCQTFPPAAKMLTVSVESPACAMFYTEGACGGSPFPKCGNNNNCYIAALGNNFQYRAFEVVPNTKTNQNTKPNSSSEPNPGSPRIGPHNPDLD